MTPQPSIGVLFVCLGNICRSPLAEAVFLDRASRRGMQGRFRVDSCGIGAWHVGERADPRTIAIGRRHGVEVTSIARQLAVPGDFERFEWLIAMDRSNARHLLGAGAPPSSVHLMRSFDPALRGRPDHELDVPDPYHGGSNDFEEVFRMLDTACQGLLERLLEARPGNT